MVQVHFQKDNVKSYSTRRLMGASCIIVAVLMAIAFFIVCMVTGKHEWAYKAILFLFLGGASLLLSAKVLDKIFDRIANKL